jgi:hypothetical protein
VVFLRDAVSAPSGRDRGTLSSTRGVTVSDLRWLLGFLMRLAWRTLRWLGAVLVALITWIVRGGRRRRGAGAGSAMRASGRGSARVSARVSERQAWRASRRGAGGGAPSAPPAAHRGARRCGWCGADQSAFEHEKRTRL